jgi:hypothetical protein
VIYCHGWKNSSQSDAGTRLPSSATSRIRRIRESGNRSSTRRPRGTTGISSIIGS